MPKLDLSEFDYIEVINVPNEMTSEETDRLKEIKDSIIDWEIITQTVKDELDFLAFLRSAAWAKARWDNELAVKCYKRALWEQKYGSRFWTVS